VVVKTTRLRFALLPVWIIENEPTGLVTASAESIIDGPMLADTTSPPPRAVDWPKLFAQQRNTSRIPVTTGFHIFTITENDAPVVPALSRENKDAGKNDFVKFSISLDLMLNFDNVIANLIM